MLTALTCSGLFVVTFGAKCMNLIKWPMEWEKNMPPILFKSIAPPSFFVLLIWHLFLSAFVIDSDEFHSDKAGESGNVVSRFTVKLKCYH